MRFAMPRTAPRRLAAGLCAAAALVAVSSGAASAAEEYRIYGGSYASYAQCNQAGSLTVGLGLYSRYECNPNDSSSRYLLWYVD
ncbi:MULTISPECIES: hypothetical protein [unclassified Streptomyces]|uniref:hypothetical protein n=1 Tax=unclassified Streptomyces TaxID=2593676 RepID=UPI00109E52D0|nr:MULTISPECIES: hypothetical protein [unclassified Streptomyces]THA51634.1 hypothetical protein E6R62_22260 [Streptomyces sp. A1136]WUC68961.1 hypothetical protein OG861_32370 [Streptomyces sp. NBC_00539]